MLDHGLGMKNLFLLDQHMHRVTNTSVLELYKNLQHHESDCFKKVTIMLSEGCGSLANLDSIMSMTCKHICWKTVA